MQHLQVCKQPCNNFILHQNIIICSISLKHFVPYCVTVTDLHYSPSFSVSKGNINTDCIASSYLTELHILISTSNNQTKHTEAWVKYL